MPETNRDDAGQTRTDSTVESVYKAVFRDGTIDASIRQGADELWQALKAFPDTIEAHEPGTVLNPLYGTLAERQASLAPSPAVDREMSPSEIVRETRENSAEPEQTKQNEQGRGRE